MAAAEWADWEGEWDEWGVDEDWEAAAKEAETVELVAQLKAELAAAKEATRAVELAAAQHGAASAMAARRREAGGRRPRYSLRP